MYLLNVIWAYISVYIVTPDHFGCATSCALFILAVLSIVDNPSMFESFPCILHVGHLHYTLPASCTLSSS